MDYEPDADMVFNYLMVSALAEATDLIEKKGMKPSGKDLQDLARKVCALHKYSAIHLLVVDVSCVLFWDHGY